jgi:hypothetical protein
MARCMYNNKKVRRFRKIFGLPVLAAATRGNTGHRIDLLLEDGSIISVYPDGTMCTYGMKWNNNPERVKELKEQMK